jgi:type IV secretory pathway TrbD component
MKIKKWLFNGLLNEIITGTVAPVLIMVLAAILLTYLPGYGIGLTLIAIFIIGYLCFVWLDKSE